MLTRFRQPDREGTTGEEARRNERAEGKRNVRARDGERRHDTTQEHKEEEEEDAEKDTYVRVTERNAERHKLSGQRAHLTRAPGVDETVEREIALTVLAFKNFTHYRSPPSRNQRYRRRATAAPLRSRGTIHHFGSLPRAPRKLPPITSSATARLSPEFTFCDSPLKLRSHSRTSSLHPQDSIPEANPPSAPRRFYNYQNFYSTSQVFLIK